MRILFITAHLYLPQMFGGLQQSTNTLATALIRRGHHASVLCALSPDGLLGRMCRLKIKLSQNKIARDMLNGYPVYRSWLPWETVASVAKVEKPDVIVVLARIPVKMALAARQTGIPIMMMLQDVEFKEHGGDFKELGNIYCAANSAFTARKYYDMFGVNPHVIHPLIFPEKYKTETTREFVTYINPHHLKGLNIALEIAKACPDIPFLFQESWPLSPDLLTKLNAQIADLPNVTFQHAIPDMRQVYKRTKILLIPSEWEEAYGRVASEAQISGIPVIASNIGGLPEAVGQGGVLLDPKGDVAPWIDAVKFFWSDDAFYQDIVRSAFLHSARPDLDISNQIDAWEKLLYLVSKRV